MYPNGYFDLNAAKIFFGDIGYKRIQFCCDIERIHRLRSNIQSKPVAFRATLTEEASNKRTKTLDDWGHLRKYLEEQFDTQPLLGNIELNSEEYELLMKQLMRYYDKIVMQGSKQKENKIVCVGLVQIAIRCAGREYWPDVA